MADEKSPSGEKEDPRVVDESKMNSVVIGADDAPNFYSDAMEISTSLYDFKLHVRVTIRREPEVTTYRELCLLHISPPHFKKLVTAMKNNLEVYERLFGPITQRPVGPPPEEIQ